MNRDIHMEEWMTALKEMRSEEVVPPGWATVRQLASIKGVQRRHMGKIINALAKRGLIDSRLFRVKTRNGVVQPVVHYKIKRKK